MAGDRKIKVTPMTGMMSNCVRVAASSGGKTTHWAVCATGLVGTRLGLSVTRGGRRGGVRSENKSKGGIVACSSKGQDSKCVKAPYGVSLFPGGGGKLKRLKIPVYSGLKRRKK